MRKHVEVKTFFAAQIEALYDACMMDSFFRNFWLAAQVRFPNVA